MKKQKKIIFVNSFKGGTGKTTLSMKHCIDALFHEKEYENIIYLDLDVLGTATSYLFEDGKLPEDKSFDKTGKPCEVNLRCSLGSGTFYVGYLSQELKMNANYGEACFLHHQKVSEEIFIKRVTDFIDEQIKEETSSLIVIDCAPGFGEIEQKVLSSCYKKKELDIIEEYLVTLDSAHVRKCAQCLNEYKVSTEVKKRNVCLVVNDVQNYCGFLSEKGDDDMEEMDKIMGEIYDLFYTKSSKTTGASQQDMTFRLWKYSQNISVESVYMRSEYLENHADDYLFTIENYIKWKAGSGFVYS